MKALLLASAALAASLATPAHATYFSESCGPPIISIGAAGKTWVTSVHVIYDAGDWHVVHQLSNGTYVDRGNQYAISDQTTIGADKLVYTKWTGPLMRNNALQMTGVLGMKGGVPHYWETLVKNGSETVMQSEAVCSFDNPPAPAAAPSHVATTQPPAGGALQPTGAAPSSGQFAVALNDIPGFANTQYVAVTIGAVDYHMTVDTGCSFMTVTPALADWLINNGQATFIRSVQSSLADGSTRTSRFLSIGQISIGGHVLTNVEASDGAADTNDGSMLLGIGVLKRFGKFSIDAAGHQLVLG
jgi:gag-polyprotein putative aspartyl protease